MEINILDKLNELDTQAFVNDEKVYDLSFLYESQNFPVDKKKKLVEMLSKETVNQKEIYNYLVGNFKQSLVESKLVEDDELDFNDEELNDGTFTATAYYATNFSGTEDTITTSDYSELEDWVWDKLQKGFFVIADGVDGLNHRYSPDKVEWGEETYGIEDYLVEDLQEGADAEKLKQLQDAQKKFNDKTAKAEKSIDKSLNQIDKKSNLIKKIFGKKNESLTEAFEKDIYDTANDMLKVLEENDLWAELYDVKKLDDSHYSIDLEINGDWKHDHLRSDWVLSDWAVRNNCILENHGTTETETDGSDWYKGVHHYVLCTWEEVPEDEEEQGVIVIRESYADDLADDDLDNPKAYQNKKFTNGTLAEFDPQNLMNKVAETGYAINTVRENGDDTYFISIHYKEWFGPKGIDNPEELYYVDVVKETADGKQTREVLQDGTADEIVKLLNDWKASVV